MRTVSEEFDLNAYLAVERDAVEAALRRALDHLLPLLPESLRGATEQGVLAGGKRLRPILFLAAWRGCFEGRRGAQGSESSEVPGDAIVGGDAGAGADAADLGPVPEALYDLAASLELIHAYSLMHDDLPCMDDAPLRRGAPTPHTIYGEEATILGGAALIPAAGLQCWRASGALGLPDPARRELIELLARAAGAGGMVGGQGLDLLGEGRALPRAELDTLHRGKTGALLTASLVMGGVAAGATPEERAALEEYGREIGLAFQIADDVLDATSSAETLGKLPSDMNLEKSTYVLLLGVEGARAEARDRIDRGVAALRGAGITSPALEGLALYVVERDR